MFSESLYFGEIQNSNIIWATFFTLHLLQNNPLVPMYTSASDCKGDTNIPWSHFIKAFSFFHRILNYVISITKAPPLQSFISVERTGKNQLQPGQWGWYSRDVTFFFIKKSLPKPTGVLEHCREGETNAWLSIFSVRFVLTTPLRRRRMSVYISLFTAAIPINRTRDFLKILSANYENFWSYYV